MNVRFGVQNSLNFILRFIRRKCG